ncbi:alpha/beta fold hydrolase [Chloroflexus sp.]|uniref:alpha/beta fold hydrolase n=1 Tax=Chloroflexus sp. TaxID=1904827 RepID=UPI00263799DB|nr:alpha/beta fold hydrolase [uncultured Chloroflexus sp.]
MRSRWLRVNGYQLHWLEAGRGPAVLLLHGFAGSSDDWAPTVEWLAQNGYRALAVDALGFGRSEKPVNAPYGLELQSDLYAALLAALNIDRATFVAHSMGGKYALATAIRHPLRVARLVLIATDGFVEPSPLTIIGGWPFIGEVILWLSAHPAVVRAFLSAAFHNPAPYVTAELIERGQAAISGAANRRALTSLSRRYAATDLGLTGLRSRLSTVRAPTLLVWGAQDRVFPLRYAETARREIPGAQLVVIQHCGHFPHIEAARPFLGLLSGFLAPLCRE